MSVRFAATYIQLFTAQRYA